MHSSAYCVPLQLPGSRARLCFSPYTQQGTGPGRDLKIRKTQASETEGLFLRTSPPSAQIREFPHDSRYSAKISCWQSSCRKIRLSVPAVQFVCVYPQEHYITEWLVSFLFSHFILHVFYRIVPCKSSLIRFYR